MIFETKAPEKNFDSERKKLFAKIGELEMVKEWLKKNQERPDYE